MPEGSMCSPQEVQFTPLRGLEFLEVGGDVRLEAHALDHLLGIESLQDPEKAHLFGFLMEIEQGLGGHHPPGSGPPGQPGPLPGPRAIEIAG